MKKLLGLLAVAPMAVTACGSKDPVEVKIEENVVTYSVEGKVLTVTNINLSGDDDAEGYNKLGEDIKTAWTSQDAIGDATRIILEGKLGDKDIHKEIDVNGILDDADTATSFTSFRDALRHYYKAKDGMTSYGVFAKHLRDAGTHKEPLTPPTEAELATMRNSILAQFTDSATGDAKWISSLKPTDAYAAMTTAGIDSITQTQQFVDVIGIDATTITSFEELLATNSYHFGEATIGGNGFEYEFLSFTYFPDADPTNILKFSTEYKYTMS